MSKQKEDYRIVKSKKGDKDFARYTGRTKIESRQRNTSFSKRAETGGLVVQKASRFCGNCGHEKILISTGSGKIKCSKCKIRREK